MKLISGPKVINKTIELFGMKLRTPWRNLNVVTMSFSEILPSGTKFPVLHIGRYSLLDVEIIEEVTKTDVPCKCSVQSYLHL